MQVTEAQRYYLNLAPECSTGLVVVCGGVERMAADYRVDRATFPFQCVEFVVEGAGTLDLRGKRYALRPGMAFAYAPGIAHLISSDPDRPMRKYYVDFAGPEAVGLLAATPLGKWVPAQIASPQELLACFEALQRDSFAEEPAASHLCAAHLRVLLLKIAQKAMPASTAEPRALASYQRARSFIQNNFVSLQTAEAAALGCHMTPVHLSRIFRRFAQTTPYHFLMRLKMNRAAELLLDSGVLVKQAAQDLGFASPFQFSRAFKRVYGIAPDHFVRQSPRSAPPRNRKLPGSAP